ncbi:hypothetical protein RERY_56370 [Rhodococcus erythropolis]|jgi:hypothetical protein|nr:hypothetical protein RERY_56370 [Rhodococcus erythropolis]
MDVSDFDVVVWPVSEEREVFQSSVGRVQRHVGMAPR